MKFSRRVTRDFRYFQSSPVSIGRKVGAVVAFAIGGIIACVSGIALLDPETPSALALANLPSASSPVLQTPPAPQPVVAATPAAPAEPATVIAAVPVKVEKAEKGDMAKPCPRGAEASCDPATVKKAAVPNALPISPERLDFTLSRKPTAANVLPGTVGLVDVPPVAKPVVVKVVTIQGKADPQPVRKPAPRETPVAAATPAKQGEHDAPDLSPNVADAAAAAVPAPTKPKKVARPQYDRRYDDRYYRNNRQNFFSFFWR